MKEAGRRGYLGTMRTVACPVCAVPMDRAELRAQAPRVVGRVGAPMPPRPVLPTWRCRSCGRQQPRIEE